MGGALYKTSYQVSVLLYPVIDPCPTAQCMQGCKVINEAAECVCDTGYALLHDGISCKIIPGTNLMGLLLYLNTFSKYSVY